MPDGMKRVGLVSRPNLPDDRCPDGAMGVSAGAIPPTSENRAALEKTLAARFSNPQDTELFMLAIDGSQDGIWDWDVEKNTLYLSNRHGKIFAYPKQEMPDIFDNWEALIHADDVDRHRDAMAAHLKGDRDYHSAEFRMRRKDGAWSWMCVRGPGIRGADGRVRRVACAASDIAERKAFEYARVDAEKRARQAQNRLADAINVYADGFALFDSGDRLELSNEQLAAAFGQSAGRITEGVRF